LRQGGGGASDKNQLEELKGEFLNVAAHELRSPLGIVRGYVSMLREGVVPPDQMRRVLTLLANKTDEMARIIDEMLEAARLGSAGVAYTLESVDLVEVIDDALTAMEPLLRDPHRLTERGEREPIIVDGDRRRLTMVLTNLIDNAVKYSPQGGAIDVSWNMGDGRAVVRVRDEGLGMDAADTGVLFTRFGRIVTPENSHIMGTGLGLYIARDIVNQHGGDITVESVPGNGSTFTVSLPLAAKTNGRLAVGAPAAKPAAGER
jgi:two-component system, OmpR family, sensor histidine kinase VicK